ncbi:S8/S53 family peptidase [Cryptosporangium phraense]|uniref:S8/S53 family peptidase n=1 Tax=Cryptosporangium phraense TaxID=2593070 RepID=A0A545AET5_9ACTN|nr:S8/S53 family peptidase [Cryptosporangium phraense]TQS39834.1 S8/S53 family peptidase [Cryptosporangium phraense]
MNTLYVDIVNRAAVKHLIDAVAADVAAANVSDVDGVFGLSAEESNAELGLTKLDLTGVLTAASVWPEASLDGLDTVIGLLGEKATTLFGGWDPEITRDRGVGIFSSPHVKGSDALPEPVAARGFTFPEGSVGPDSPRIGIADTLIFEHPDLLGHIEGESTASPQASSGHATFVAGIVRRRAPEALLVCKQVLGPNLHDSWSVATRLVEFVDEGVSVINMSFGALVSDAPTPLRRAIDRIGTNAVLVASGGNYAQNRIGTPNLYPAFFNDVVAVGSGTVAADGSFELADTTPDRPWLDLVADGVIPVGLFLEGEVHFVEPRQGDVDFPQPYASWAGSSFAAATVTGEIARRMSVDKLSAFDALDQLLNGEASDIAPYRRLS